MTPLFYLSDSPIPPKPGKYPGDVGIDLAVDIPERRAILPGHGQFLPAGFQAQLPYGHCALVLPRSSTNQAGLLVMTGVIDTGYSGVIGMQVHNITCDPIWIEPGQRLAQLVLFEGVYPSPVPVARFNPTDRGANGWGSSGG